MTPSEQSDIGPVPIEDIVDCGVCDAFAKALAARWSPCAGDEPTLEEVRALADTMGYEPRHLRYRWSLDGSLVVVWNQGGCCR
jgi:hypothetical protein